MKAYATVDAYIRSYPKEIQSVLNEMRALVHASAPHAEECIGYGIPSYKLHGRYLVHFGAFKKHLGFFPASSGVSEFRDLLTQYTCSKGTIQFPYTTKLPRGLIQKIVKFRIAENKARARTM
ncbi:MAG: DUF1801 domain-containing protein [Minisyncoccia bacterium]